MGKCQCNMKWCGESGQFMFQMMKEAAILVLSLVGSLVS
jgi:hypothetical protein